MTRYDTVEMKATSRLTATFAGPAGMESGKNPATRVPCVPKSPQNGGSTGSGRCTAVAGIGPLALLSLGSIQITGTAVNGSGTRDADGVRRGESSRGGGARHMQQRR